MSKEKALEFMRSHEFESITNALVLDDALATKRVLTIMADGTPIYLTRVDDDPELVFKASLDKEY